MIYSLVYLSFEVDSVSEDTLKNILAIARSNNEKLDVSGLLLYANGVFIQNLEGDKEKVVDLYNKISTDARHKNCMILYESEILNRNFENWTMGFTTPNEEEMKSFGDFKSEDEYSKELDTSDNTVLQLMKRIYDRNENRSDL